MLVDRHNLINSLHKGPPFLVIKLSVLLYTICMNKIEHD